MEGWDPKIAAVIKKTPEHQLVDYKLLWRDPLPGWVSKHGRVMLVGDSAHPFLPTSGQGAGQAVEDAATVAVCLELAEKDQVPLALQTCEKLRYVPIATLFFAWVCGFHADKSTDTREQP